MTDWLRLTPIGLTLLVQLVVVVLAFANVKAMVAKALDKADGNSRRLEQVEAILKNGINAKLAGIVESQSNAHEQLERFAELPQRIASLEARCMERSLMYRITDKERHGL